MEPKQTSTRRRTPRRTLGGATAADAVGDIGLERWLAAAGLSARVVPACPDAGCDLCPAPPAYVAA